jgi:hypothetical protein
MNKVNIYGGLGNQMFQYALSCVLVSRGSSSKISFRDFFFYNHHNGFELSRAFYLDLGFMDKLKLKILKSGSSIWRISIVKKVMYYSFQLYSYLFEKIVNERIEFSYDEKVFDVSNSRLIGTWQSVKYLVGHEDMLKYKFKFKTPLDSINIGLAYEIQKNNSIAVHIRRGDYTKAEWRDSHLVIDGTDYYMKAIDFMISNLDNPVFYFFSDDMEWVKANFKATNFKFIDHNKGNMSYLDMYLMSLCSNFIIANSTFSWWGAWLSLNPNKKVIIPSPWIKGLDATEIYPDNWVIYNI